MRFGFVLLAVGAGLALRGTVVLAYREVISLGEVKRCSAAVVLGTLQNVKRVPLADGTARLSEPRHGFAFDLKICEVLHGKADELGKEVRIGYSSAGNGGVWEFAETADGLKVLAYLQRAEDGRWGLVPSCEVVTALPNFDAPEIWTLRKELAVLDISGPTRQLECIKAGRTDPDGGYREFCIRALGELDGSWTGVDLSTVLAPGLALSLVWETYRARETPLDTVWTCDRVFANEFRAMGWEGYPVRYPILRDSIRRQIAFGKVIQHNLFDHAIIDLCGYPEQAREAYQVLLSVLDGKHEIYQWIGASHLSLVYHARTPDRRLKELNRVVWAKLLELGASTNESLADGAAIAIDEVACEFEAFGGVPDEIKVVVDGKGGPPGLAKHAYRFRGFLHRRAAAIRGAIKELPANAEDAEVLAAPWDDFVGRKVLVAGRFRCHDDRYGDSMEVAGQRRLWVIPKDPGPRAGKPFSPAVLVGKLAKKYDLPVFRYRAGEPFGGGLPVPDNVDLQHARCRYVLEAAVIREVDLDKKMGDNKGQ